MTPPMTQDALNQPWRIGRKVGRTIYTAPPDSEDGELIGVMDTPELASEAVDAHNFNLLRRLNNREGG